MFHFMKKKQKEIEQTFQPMESQQGMYKQPNVFDHPIEEVSATAEGMSKTIPTADELFEKTMAPTLSPKAFMEQNAINSHFSEPEAVPNPVMPHIEKTVPIFDEANTASEADITAWQEMGMKMDPTDKEAPHAPTELFKDPAAHGEVGLEDTQNKRILKFVGNNGGSLYYHSRMEEETISSTQELNQIEADGGVWICECGTHNYASFCAECGKVRPTE